MNIQYGTKNLTINPKDMITTCQPEYINFLDQMKQSEGIPFEKSMEVTTEARQAYIECCKTKFIQPLLRKSS